MIKCATARMTAHVILFPRNLMGQSQKIISTFEKSRNNQVDLASAGVLHVMPFSHIFSLSYL